MLSFRDKFHVQKGANVALTKLYYARVSISKQIGSVRKKYEGMANRPTNGWTNGQTKRSLCIAFSSKELRKYGLLLSY